jgi:hypothetical protein
MKKIYPDSEKINKVSPQKQLSSDTSDQVEEAGNKDD